MSIKIIGYHGTHIKNVNSILTSGFSHDFRHDHWLGQGIYFYDNIDLAKWWIDTKIKYNIQRFAAVIYVEVDALPEKILDLDTNSGIESFFRELKLILKNLSISAKFDPKETFKNLCWALDLLKQSLGLGIITMTFLKKNPSYGAYPIQDFENNFFPLPFDFRYKEKQICVTDNSYIRLKECCYPRRTKWS